MRGRRLRRSGPPAAAAVCLGLAAAWAATPAQGQTTRGVALPSAPAKEAAPGPIYGASHALVIGIDAYHAGWPRLGNAVKDAELVAAELRAKGFQVSLHKDLSASELKDTFERFFVVAGSDKEARLFVWFAGHGHTEEGLGFLVPADAPRPGPGPEFRLKALSLRRFGEFVRLARSKHAMAIFDACFAGTIFASQRSMPPAAITRATGLPVRQFVSSGDANQEVSDDGRFRKLFLRALRGETVADANGDGFLTGSELGLFLTDRVTNLTNARQTPRYGKLNDEDFDRGDFVFGLTSASTVADVPPPAYGGVERGPRPAQTPALDDPEFAATLERFRAVRYSERRVEFVQGLPPSQRFTTRQVAQLLKKVPHSNVRVRCLDLLAPRITDPQNYQEILRVLTFRAEKDHTRKLLSGD